MTSWGTESPVRRGKLLGSSWAGSAETLPRGPQRSAPAPWAWREGLEGLEACAHLGQRVLLCAQRALTGQVCIPEARMIFQRGHVLDSESTVDRQVISEAGALAQCRGTSRGGGEGGGCEAAGKAGTAAFQKPEEYFQDTGSSRLWQMPHKEDKDKKSVPLISQ